MQSVSGFDINYLTQEARIRWLKPVEVFSILRSYEEHQLSHQIPQKPSSGSLYLFNKRELKFFRKDGHRWRRRRDQGSVAEAHERLKVGNVEALNCYYAHGEDNRDFQRRSYWILDPVYEHIVLVHYRDVHEGRQNVRSTSHFPTLPSILNHSPTPSATHNPDSSVVVSGSHVQLYQSSSRSVEIISSPVMKNHGSCQLDIKETTENNSPSSSNLSEALRSIKQQLSLHDDEEKEVNTLHIDNQDSNDLVEDAPWDFDLSGKTSKGPDNFLSQESDNGVQQHHQLSGDEVATWRELLDCSSNMPSVESGSKSGGQDDSSLTLRTVDAFQYPAYSPVPDDFGITADLYATLYDQHMLGTSLVNNLSLTVAQKQKFTIREISPDWCFSSDGAKIIIIGSFLTDPSECEWTCMIGESEVPVQIIQEGILRCHAPPHVQGKVNICITSGNREACSEVREFEYRTKPNSYMHSNPPETNASKSSEEQLLLARFLYMLLSDRLPKGDIFEFGTDLLGKSRFTEGSCSHLANAIHVGTSTSSSTLDWLLQELLKDKLESWLSTKLQQNDGKGCSLSKKEQGIIHMVAGLGFEWALLPILSSGVNIDFRDDKGWTALHWAAQFGRENMVAALIASGASAGAVTHPNSRERTGIKAASIAAANGHRGLAGYLSEVELTSHLSSLTLAESELSKEYAALEAENKVNSLQKSSSTNEDQDSLKQTLAAARNATQAASRIQAAFRLHSFRKRKQREAALSTAGANEDAYSVLSKNIHGLSAASKLGLGLRDYNSAALTIQKRYRSWNGRKNFLALRRKVVMIQAHVRGYQARKHYKICWAVSILEKIILRWRRGAVGLRGFKLDLESINENEGDEDILREFRKEKVDAVIEEAVSRVLSMVESPEARQQYSRIFQKYREAVEERSMR